MKDKKSIEFIEAEKFLLQKIKQFRKKQGLNQKQIAEKLGISQVTYSDVELGRIELSVNRLIALIIILDIKDILDDSMDENASIIRINKFIHQLQEYIQSNPINSNQKEVTESMNEESDLPKSEEYVTRGEFNEIKSLLQEILIKLNEKP